MTSSGLGLLDVNQKIKWRPTTLKMQFKNSYANFWLSPEKKWKNRGKSQKFFLFYL